MSLLTSARSRAFAGLLSVVAAFAAVTLSALPASAGAPGTVYTITNQASGNQVVAYDRSHDGKLEFAGSYSTGGAGNGANLGSQGAVQLSDDGRYLLVVNAGSNTVSVFSTTGSGLELLDVEPSGGLTPTGLAIQGGLVYVMNDGDDTISGFHLDHGQLVAIPGSTQAVTASDQLLSQVEFGPGATTLVLTIRSTNEIVTFTLDSNGVAGGRQSFASAGLAPFGFKIDRAGHVIVSEAASGLSAYQLAADGSLQVINGPVSTTQAAPCWVLISKDGRYAFTANAGSASISSVSIAKDGTIALVQPVAGTTDGGPLDMALSVDGRFLYTVSRATGVVTSFAVNADGSLTQIDGDGGLPIGAVFGLAAR